MILSSQSTHMFQSTPTYGGRRNAGARRFGADGSFNPRPRTVGDFDREYHERARKEFQSTPTYGGRRGVGSGGSIAIKVSIHAHVRWATHWRTDERDRQSVSIHAHVRWATISGIELTIIQQFQSTPTYGGRLAGQPQKRLIWEFQSTPTYGGRRAFVVPVQVLEDVSIHAHVRWATASS